MPLWTSQQLEIWENEALEKISSEIRLILKRVSIAIISGNPFYPILDANGNTFHVVAIQRLTWQGRKLTPLSRVEFRELYPHANVSIVSSGSFDMGAFDNAAFDVQNIISQGISGRPEYYAYTGHDWNTIQFYPTPNIAIPGGGSDLFAMADIREKVIATVYVCSHAAADFPLVAWKMRTVLRSYVLSQAYRKEGPGQRMDLANYHAAKFQAGLEVFKRLNEGVFISQKARVRDNVLLTDANRRSPRRPYLYSDEIPTLG